VGGNDIMRLRAIYMMEQYRSMSVCIDTHAPVSLESWEHALSKFETLLQETLYWDLCFDTTACWQVAAG
jgi:hypothetical protein